jgi:ligand-binding sensor domain-containing protein/signal transduction histidine kinase/CheY-like chemotaxis protein
LTSIRKYVFLCFLILSIHYLHAQRENALLSNEKKLIQYNIDNWDFDDGLPTNSLTDICQTEDGYIWISGYQGLIRFDGINFKVFDKSNTSVFKENGIGAFGIDSKGKLWMTTQNSGLVSYKNGYFQTFGSEQGIEHLLPVLFIDSKDRIFSSAIEGGWFIFDQAGFTMLKHSSDLENIELQAICEDKSGNIWFGTTGKGLYKYDGKIFTIYNTETGLSSNWLRALFFDQNDLLWIACDQGVSVYDGTTFRKVSALDGYAVNRITSDKRGNLWFATTEGLFRRNSKTGEFEYLSTANGLMNNYINSLLIDNEDNIWVIYYKAGLSRLNKNKFISYTGEKGMPGTLVNSVCEIDPGRFLIAFDNGGLCIIEDGYIKPYRTKGSLEGERIRHVFKDSKKNLWISTYSGLLKIQPDNKEVWYKEETGFPAKYIRLTYEDSRNTIWIGSRNNGVIRFNKDGSYTVFDKRSGLSSNIIMSIDEDASGNIIVGTSKGGINIISAKGEIKHYSVNEGLSGDIVFNTYCDKEGIIWISTNGGLSCFKDNQILRIRSGSLNLYPVDVLEDKNGNLWMPSFKGVYKVERRCLLQRFEGNVDTCEIKLYGKFDGITQPECNATAKSIKGSDGTLWFPTLDGVTTVDPNNIIYNDFVPPVYIEEIFIDNIPVQNTNSVIEFRAGKKRITFNYTALSYNEPKRVKFKYKLEGFEEEWSTPESNRSVSYTNLPPGDYTFKVIACNNDELWNTEGAEMHFTVVPHFIQTNLFYFLVVIFITILAYLFYRIRVQSLKNDRKKLETIVKIRTDEVSKKNIEISSQNEELIRYKDHLEEMIKERTIDLEAAKKNAERADKLKTVFLENLSHEIRTPLNAIVGFSTILESDENLSENSKRSIQHIYSGSNSLTKIVDSIMQASRLQIGDVQKNETEFSVYDLMKKIYSDFSFCFSVQNKENILFRFFAEGVKDLIATCDQEMLYTILYNLIDNAIKFTENGIVEYGAEFDGQNYLKFYVKDSGIGISHENLDYIFDKFRKIETSKSVLYRGLGLGLNISKSLVNHLNGQITVESTEGKGSCFSIAIPLTKFSMRKRAEQDLKAENYELPNLQGKKILIVEDELLNMIYLETAIKETMAQLFTARNGREAIEIFRMVQDIDLILMDIKMHEVDGIEATIEIRTGFPKNKVKIIAQTAYTMDHQREKILVIGFNDYIEKPIDLNNLMQMIKKQLHTV